MHVTWRILIYETSSIHIFDVTMQGDLGEVLIRCNNGTDSFMHVTWRILIWDITSSYIHIWDITYSYIHIWDITYSYIHIRDITYLYIWRDYAGRFGRSLDPLQQCALRPKGRGINTCNKLHDLLQQSALYLWKSEVVRTRAAGRRCDMRLVDMFVATRLCVKRRASMCGRTRSCMTWRIRSWRDLRERKKARNFPGPQERARAETGGADQWVLKRRECSGFARVNKVASASLGYPLSVFIYKNSTLKDSIQTRH